VTADWGTRHLGARCGYEVTGMILYFDLKGVRQLDHSRGMSVHIATCTSYDLNASTPFVRKTWRW